MVKRPTAMSPELTMALWASTELATAAYLAPGRRRPRSTATQLHSSHPTGQGRVYNEQVGREQRRRNVPENTEHGEAAVLDLSCPQCSANKIRKCPWGTSSLGVGTYLALLEPAEGRQASAAVLPLGGHHQVAAPHAHKRRNISNLLTVDGGLDRV